MRSSPGTGVSATGFGADTGVTGGVVAQAATMSRAKGAIRIVARIAKAVSGR